MQTIHMNQNAQAQLSSKRLWRIRKGEIVINISECYQLRMPRKSLGLQCKSAVACTEGICAMFYKECWSPTTTGTNTAMPENLVCRLKHQELCVFQVQLKDLVFTNKCYLEVCSPSKLLFWYKAYSDITFLGKFSGVIHFIHTPHIYIHH